MVDVTRTLLTTMTEHHALLHQPSLLHLYMFCMLLACVTIPDMTHLQSPRPLTPRLWDVLQDLGSGDLVVIQATCQVDPLMSQQAVNVLSAEIDIVQENYFISFEGKRGLAVTTTDATATIFAVAFAILVQKGFAAD